MSTPTSSRASQIGITPEPGERPGPTGTDAEPWWRSAVVYQIYPRSFFDADGDGTGDLRGITSHLDHVVSLGADAIWISPWYPSPMVDGGYDVADYCDIHPDFGTLDDAETLIDTAHAKGLRVLIDLVPNHCSSQHPWFREALSGGPGHPMRDRFVFRDGTGAHSELPPNNWPSVFGGSAWQRVVEPDGKPGQWYLHFFDPGQPDWNWDNEEVRAEFDRILRFWFDRGVDGFRVDVADALVKDMSLPDVPIDPRTGRGTLDKSIDNPMWNQPGLAEVQRRWRAIAREYADTPSGERVFVAEAYLPHDRLVQFLAPDRFQMSFDFEFLQSAWDADSLRWVIDGCLAAHARTGSSNDEQAAELAAGTTWTGLVGATTSMRARPPGSSATTTSFALPPDMANPSPELTSDIRRISTTSPPRRCPPTSIWDGVEPGLPCCWRWPCPAVPTCTRARNLALTRCRYPPTVSRTPPGSVPGMSIAAGTAAGCRSPGAIGKPPTGGRRPPTPGCRYQITGPSSPWRPRSRTRTQP